MQADLEDIIAKVGAGRIRLTQHAHQEMVAEAISLDAVIEAIASAQVLEDYPEHRRGSCCLLHGVTSRGRHLHVVCTTSLPMVVIITAYEPKPPKWPSPTQRRRN
ncbi:MAG: DUF4258 domain-containing protein [Phycisphaerae bacterium]|nr:DUF4258 domain-containing protein [Phycisphaerae bacterium]